MESCKAMANRVRFMKKPIINSNEWWLDYIGDSGAGRLIWSDEAFEEQGIPRSFYKKFLGPASDALSFDTGNGPVPANETLMLSSPGLGKQEAYRLRFSPAAGSMGCTVEDADQPLFWTKGVKPFFCSDKTKMKVFCTESYKIYAHRVDNYVPYWREKVRFDSKGNIVRSIPKTYYNTPSNVSLCKAYNQKKDCGCGLPHTSALPGPSSPSEQLVPDVPLANPDEVVEDPSVNFRSLSKEALLAEAKTKEHLSSHFPYNP